MGRRAKTKERRRARVRLRLREMRDSWLEGITGGERGWRDIRVRTEEFS